MKDFVKTKVVTGLVVTATVILGGVAIFTGLRLYQLRQQSVALNSPESSFAWDCSRYTFSLEANGLAKVSNSSTRSEPSQQAKLYINGSLVATFDVPALTPGQNADLGSVNLPQTGAVTWRIDGTRDCANTGTLTVTKSSCDAITFTILTPTVSGKPTSTPTASLTPLDSPTNSPTPTTLASNTPTPTRPPSVPEPEPCVATKPTAVTITSVMKSGTEATVTWTKSTLATHYVIAYGTSTDNLIYGVPNTGNVTSYKVGSLNSGSTYYFVVYAVNDCQPSDVSNVKSSVAGTGTAVAEASPTEAQLPATGFSVPTLYGAGFGVVILLIALALAI